MSEIEIIECNQGGDDWHRVRAGAVTASMFGEIITRLKSGPRKGEYSAKAEAYAFKLAVERISGEPLQGEEFETYAMRRGHELEPQARALHGDVHGLEIEKAGFVRTSDGKFGASADGLVGETMGCEYKCLVAPEKLSKVLLDGIIDEFIPQCQGGLWLTGRQTWHLCFYCPMLASIGRDLTTFRLERDEDYIEMLEQKCVEFDRHVEAIRAKLELRDKADELADAFG